MIDHEDAGEVVVATGLRREFAVGRGRAPVLAADEVSFRIGRGECLGLVGESGSGKSTIARIIVGLERADAGSLTIDGEDRFAPGRGREVRLRRARQAQMVFQDPFGSLDRRLSAERIVADAVRDSGERDRRVIATRTRELLDRVRIGTDRSGLRPRDLSGGQRQRLAIARALAMRPSLLVMDEAVSALDVSVQAEVLDLVAEIRRDSGVAVLFVSHDLDVVAEAADDVLVLHRGSVVERGDAERVLQSPQHPYTQLLVSSIPGEHWDPHEVIRRRTLFEQRR